MPYIDGKRVSQEEFIRANSGEPTYLHTGPGGDNPAPAPELDEERKPITKVKKAGSKRSKTSAKSASAAIADALGVSAESLPDLSDSDVEADSADGE